MSITSCYHSCSLFAQMAATPGQEESRKFALGVLLDIILAHGPAVLADETGKWRENGHIIGNHIALLDS